MKLAIGNRFGRAVETYESAASVQKLAASACAENVPAGEYADVLEIGAGWGILTHRLAERVRFERYVALDIAPAALAASARSERIFPVAADGESPPFRPGSFDLLASSSTLQWYGQPEDSLPENIALLKKGGRFSLALFVRGTLKELAEASRATGFASVYPLPEEERILGIMRGIPGIRLESEARELTAGYSGVREFLKSLKLTGAGFTHEKRAVSRARYREFVSFYERRFGTGSGVSATYRVLYLRGEVTR